MVEGFRGDAGAQLRADGADRPALLDGDEAIGLAHRGKHRCHIERAQAAEVDHFRLVEGADKIATYSFNTGTAKHRFCSVCGVKGFYVPRSKPDGYSVNLRCLDDGQVRVVRIVPFDGRNWEQAFAAAQGKV